MLKLAYLGNWLANANRDGNDEDPIKEEYEKMEDYLFSFAEKFGLGEYMTHEESDGDKYFPSRKFEEETDVDELHDEYDEETFWSELPERLGDRDFHRQYSQAEIAKMTQDERFTFLCRFSDKWGEELNKNGIARLGIVK